jgi:hypothetical protein
MSNMEYYVLAVNAYKHLAWHASSMIRSRKGVQCHVHAHETAASVLKTDLQASCNKGRSRVANGQRGRLMYDLPVTGVSRSLWHLRGLCAAVFL